MPKPARTERPSRVLDESCTSPVIETDREIVVGWSPQAAKLFGWSTEEILGQKTSETLIAPTNRREFENWRQSDSPSRLSEFIAIHKSGRQFSALFKVLGNSQELGKNRGQYLIREILENSTCDEEEQELERQKAMLQYVIDFVPHSIFWKDREDKFLGGNRTFLEKALGVKSASEMIGKTDLDFFPIEQAEYFQKCDEAVMQSGEPMLDIEEPQYRLDGGLRVLVTSKVPLRDEMGKVTGLLGSFMDITDRKHMEQELEEAKNTAEAAARAKGEFLATVSHELRTPLTLILGPLEVLLSMRTSELSPMLHEELERIYRNASRLYELVNDILDFTKIEAGKGELTWENVAINRLIGEIVSDAQSAARHKNIRLSFISDENLGDVALDRGKFEKIVLNLLANALKFTPIGGKVELKVATDKDNCKDDFVLSVSDTGIGIAADQQELLFQKFQQLDASVTRKYEGTGLGLALVKQFVELMHGKVSLQSEPGRGSTFFVRLPRIADQGVTIARSDNGPKNREAKLRIVPQVGHNPKGTITEQKSLLPRLLIVEDNPDMRAYLAEILEDEFNLDTAENGVQALEHMKQVRPDLIISDIMMPEMDGLELTSRLKKSREYQQVPVILLTAKAGRDEIVSGIKTGADDYLVKPFGPAELKARVHAAHRLRELQEQLLQNSKMAAMGTLVAGLSHELNNPLAAISLNAELLMKAPQLNVSEASRAIETIRAQTDRCARLVKALLDFSRKKPLCIEPITPWALVERVGTLAAPMALKKGISIHLKAPPAELETVFLRVCVQEVETALLNLVGNAIDATSPGGKVAIEAERQVQGGRDGVQFLVIDSGAGIPEKLLSRVYDPFFTTKPPGVGTGLGLSLARAVSDSHNGALEIRSREGQGTTVRFWLPFQTTEDAG